MAEDGMALLEMLRTASADGDTGRIVGSSGPLGDPIAADATPRFRSPSAPPSFTSQVRPRCTLPDKPTG